MFVWSPSPSFFLPIGEWAQGKQLGRRVRSAVPDQSVRAKLPVRIPAHRSVVPGSLVSESGQRPADEKLGQK